MRLEQLEEAPGAREGQRVLIEDHHGAPTCAVAPSSDLSGAPGSYYSSSPSKRSSRPSSCPPPAQLALRT